MKLLISLSVLFNLSLAAFAGDLSVRVVGKIRSSDLIYVNKVWRKDLPQRLKVSLRADDEKLSAADTIFQAYFFDAAGKLLQSQNEPNKTWTNTAQGVTEVGLPDPVPSTKAAVVCLALPETLKDLKTTIVVFGRKGGRVAADVYPGEKKLEDFEFPGKAEIVAKLAEQKTSAIK